MSSETDGDETSDKFEFGDDEHRALNPIFSGYGSHESSAESEDNSVRCRRQFTTTVPPPMSRFFKILFNFGTTCKFLLDI